MWHSLSPSVYGVCGNWMTRCFKLIFSSDIHFCCISIYLRDTSSSPGPNAARWGEYMIVIGWLVVIFSSDIDLLCSLDLRVEFLLKTDSGYPRDAEVALFTLANPGSSLRFNTHWSAPPVSTLARSGGVYSCDVLFGSERRWVYRVCGNWMTCCDIWGAQQLRTGCLSILMFLAPLAEVTP